jgi:hypothetical protein
MAELRKDAGWEGDAGRHAATILPVNGIPLRLLWQIPSNPHL